MITRNVQGWTKNTEDRVATLYSPHTQWPKLSTHFLKLNSNYNIDLAELQRALKDIGDRHEFEPIIVDPVTKKKRLTYRGIGLTQRPNSVDPLYEASQYFNAEGKFVSSAKSLGIDGSTPEESKGAEFERQFTEDNHVAPKLTAHLKSMFKNWQVTKVRLMELHSSGFVPPHVDHPYYEQIRIHAVVTTNPEVYWEVEGHQFQIPADGSFYWFDTGRVHSVYNFGSTKRAVLSIHLCPPETAKKKSVVESLIEDIINGRL